MNVKAHDKATRRSQHVTITASSGLAKDEVERLVKEAQAHAEEDRRKRERIELRNDADRGRAGQAAGAAAGKPEGERKDQDTIEGEFTEKPS